MGVKRNVGTFHKCSGALYLTLACSSSNTSVRLNIPFFLELQGFIRLVLTISLIDCRFPLVQDVEKPMEIGYRLDVSSVMKATSLICCLIG